MEKIFNYSKAILYGIYMYFYTGLFLIILYTAIFHIEFLKHPIFLFNLTEEIMIKIIPIFGIIFFIDYLIDLIIKNSIIIDSYNLEKKELIKMPSNYKKRATAIGSGSALLFIILYHFGLWF